MTPILKEASERYLASIANTHSASTISTYERNFQRIVTPFFGADMLLKNISKDKVNTFLASDHLLRKPNGQPRALPTLGQITGMLKNFFEDAVQQGHLKESPLASDQLAGFRRSARRHRAPLLCSKCKAEIATSDISDSVATKVEPPAAPQGPADSTIPAAPAKTAEPATKKTATRTKATTAATKKTGKPGKATATKAAPKKAGERAA